MDQESYEQWWPLHRRAASGGALSDEERAVYESGLRELEAEENLGVNLRDVRMARERVVALEREYTQLQDEIDALRARIAAEEERLNEPTRQLLGIAG